MLLDLGLPTGSETKSEPIAEAESQSDDTVTQASTSSENVHTLALQIVILSTFTIEIMKTFFPALGTEQSRSYLDQTWEEPCDGAE